MKKILLSLFAIVAISLGVSAQWIEQATGFSEASRGINCIYTVDDQVVWASSYDGSGSALPCQDITITTNGGDLWTPHTIPGVTNLDIANVVALDANTAWVCMFPPADTTTGQGIYKTTDGGVTWARQTTAAFSAAASFANIVYFWDADHGFCMGDPINGDFEIYNTTDGGITWTLVPGANIPNPVSGEWGVVGYYSAIGNTIWFGTNKGRIYKSIDKGINWTVAAIPAWGTKFVQPFFKNENEGLAQDKSLTSTGKFAKTTDGGTTWTVFTPTGNSFTNDVAYIPGSDSTFITTGAAADKSGVTYSFNNGTSFTDMDVTIGTQFLATAWVNDSTGWAGAFSVDATTGGMFKFTSSLAQGDFAGDVTAVAMGGAVNFDILTGAHSTSTVNWAFPGGTPATSNSRHPVITYNTSGTYNVTLTVNNTWGQTVKTKTGYIYVGAVGLNEQSVASVSVFPNPVKDVLSIQGSMNIQEVTLMNMVGQVVFSMKADGTNLNINTSDLKSGIYNLKVRMADGFINKKIVVN
jgi:photosystem II stability/assembly factor-like uncharacterized protein